MSSTPFPPPIFMIKNLFVLLICVTLLIFSPLSTQADSSVSRTGQTVSYVPGDDGDLEKGVPWPLPRFTDNSNGTISDRLTNLLWLKNANCFGTVELSDALTKAGTLGSGQCGLTDGSTSGDWRLPNARELESLIHSGFTSPALPNTTGTGQAASGNPFNSLQLYEYWTNTTNSDHLSQAFVVSLRWGHILSKSKTTSFDTLFVRDNDSGTPAAAVYATGQTLCHDSAGVAVNCTATGQDGEFKKGLEWPIPRFTRNGDGTVFDRLSGLTWLENAGCFGLSGWSGAISLVNQLADNSCGLSDGSFPGDWRLPNRRELLSLIHFGFSSPALGDTTGTGKWTNSDPFTNIASSGYWSSTSYKGVTGYAWYVDLRTGIIGTDLKTNPAHIWAVRDDLISTLTVNILGDGSGTVTSSPSGISCPGQCRADFSRYDTIILTASAAIGSRFAGWSLANCGSNSTCTINISGAQSVSATFVENTSTVPAWILLLME